MEEEEEEENWNNRHWSCKIDEGNRRRERERRPAEHLPKSTLTIEFF